MSLALRNFLVGSALLFALSAQAAVIYRWVDEDGRTHVSDVVPEKYRKSATRVDSSRSEIPTEQRKQAEQAAAKNKALAEEAASRRQRTQAIQPDCSLAAFRRETPGQRRY